MQKKTIVKGIYVNLIVSDLARSRRFFEALGFTFNPVFSNDQAAALVFSDTIYAMLHTPESFTRFTKKERVDTHKAAQVLLALQLDSREEVAALMDKALAAGGMESRPAADHGFMIDRAFEDPDGNIWEVFWMDTSQFPQA